MYDAQCYLRFRIITVVVAWHLDSAPGGGEETSDDGSALLANAVGGVKRRYGRDGKDAIYNNTSESVKEVHCSRDVHILIGPIRRATFKRVRELRECSRTAAKRRAELRLPANVRLCATRIERVESLETTSKGCSY